MTAAVEKVTLSLPRELVAFADEQAVKRGTSRSRVVAELLEQERRRRVDVLAAEGYRFYGEEAGEWAQVTGVAVAPVSRTVLWRVR